MLIFSTKLFRIFYLKKVKQKIHGQMLTLNLELSNGIMAFKNMNSIQYYLELDAHLVFAQTSFGQERLVIRSKDQNLSQQKCWKILLSERNNLCREAN